MERVEIYPSKYAYIIYIFVIAFPCVYIGYSAFSEYLVRRWILVFFFSILCCVFSFLLARLILSLKNIKRPVFVFEKDHMIIRSPSSSLETMVKYENIVQIKGTVGRSSIGADIYVGSEFKKIGVSFGDLTVPQERIKSLLSIRSEKQF